MINSTRTLTQEELRDLCFSQQGHLYDRFKNQ